MEADVFLASHSSFFNLQEKIAGLKNKKSPNPFVDPSGYKEFIESAEKEFYEKLAKD